MKWKFTPYSQGETKTNPTESQFFSTTEVGNISTGLIREAIQNSLDESIYRNSTQKEPIRIKAFLSGEKYALLPSQYENYLNGLINHLNSKDSGIRTLPDFQNEKMSYLVFEDFHTNGLVGDPNESMDKDVEDKAKSHNFYHFWRNVGITGKPEDKLGRWGIGKTVFPTSSRIHSFWGLTVQKNGGQYLLGQSVLKSHNIPENPEDYGYRPYGYFAQYKNESRFPFAIDSDENIKSFKKTFGLLRKDNESGLSIVVPFHKQEIKYESLITATILNYYFPIIKGELIASISYEDETVEITSDNLLEVINNFWPEDSPNIPSKNAVLELYSFTKWSINLNDSDFYILDEQPKENQPKWIDKLWESINQEELIKHFEAEGHAAFKVPVKYQKHGDLSAKTCWFKVFFSKDENLKTAETHFVRENITIIDIKSIKNAGIRSMVLIEDKDLSNLLGDSENPSHTQWQKDSQNFIDKYIHGDKCMAFVINSVSNIYLKLQKQTMGLEKDILKNVFSITMENEEQSLDNNDDDSGKDVDLKKPKLDLPRGKKQMIRVKKIPGGIQIFPYELEQGNLPEIELELAYDTTRGNPLKKYQQLDFQLNQHPIKTIQKNCEFSFLKPNSVLFKPKNPDFEVTITGFDERRDLFINLKTKYPINDKEI